MQTIFECLYKDFIIAAEVDGEGELTDNFLVFTSEGNYHCGPCSIAEAKKEIESWNAKSVEHQSQSGEEKTDSSSMSP